MKAMVNMAAPLLAFPGLCDAGISLASAALRQFRAIEDKVLGLSYS
jgi:hypothetical protein